VNRETSEERAAAIASVLAMTRDEESSVKVAALSCLITTPPTEDRMWLSLVRGLLLILVLALSGVIYLTLLNKSPLLALTAFTTALSGLLGLLVRT
jgi:hypothetical protein